MQRAVKKKRVENPGKRKTWKICFVFFVFCNGGEASSGSAIRVHISCNLDVAVVGSVRL